MPSFAVLEDAVPSIPQAHQHYRTLLPNRAHCSPCDLTARAVYKPVQVGVRKPVQVGYEAGNSWFALEPVEQELLGTAAGGEHSHPHPGVLRILGLFSSAAPSQGPQTKYSTPSASGPMRRPSARTLRSVLDPCLSLPNVRWSVVIVL